MSKSLLIKNMVCNRCITALLDLLTNQGLEVESIQLGKIVIDDRSIFDYKKLEKQLNGLGFELIQDSKVALVEEIKTILIQKLENKETDTILQKLGTHFGKSYSVLSKTFSKSEGITLEKYLINLKIEKVKEYIQLNEFNFSEIAYSLNYKNSSHLAKQFKQVTGVSMSKYKNLYYHERIGLDKIV